MSHGLINVCFLFVGPTSYAPVIEAAMDIVEKTHGQFHVLVIVADGQVYTVKLYIQNYLYSNFPIVV